MRKFSHAGSFVPAEIESGILGWHARRILTSCSITAKRWIETHFIKCAYSASLWLIAEGVAQ